MSGRTWAFVALSSASVLALLQCGGTVETVTDTSAAGSAGLNRAGGAGQAGHAGHASSAGAGSAGSPTDAGPDAYTDPGCPDAGPPVEVSQCDAFATVSGCGQGEGCFPFVEHPVDGCGAQSFGTRCSRAGTGQQGDFCGDGSGLCAAGFVCVVGSQPGMHCVQLCRMGVQGQCPAGMICGELDVEGFGVCS